MNLIEKADPDVWKAILHEKNRQQDGLEMIASENYTSPAIMACQGSVLTNKREITGYTLANDAKNGAKIKARNGSIVKAIKNL